MAITLKIRWDEGPLQVTSNSGSGNLEYIAFSNDPTVDGRDEVMSALFDTAPADLFGLVIDSISVNERITEGTDEAIWDCTVEYVAAQSKQPYTLFNPVVVGEPRPVRLKIGNGSATSVNQIRSLEYLGESVKDNNPIYQFGGVAETANLLGFKSDTSSAKNFSVEGITKSLYTTEIHVETAALDTEVQGGYAYDMSAYAGKNVLNSKDWRGFPARSLKFTGFYIQQRAEKKKDPDGNPDNNVEPWDMNLVFSFAPPETIDYPFGISPILPPGGGDPITVKAGWEYLDVMYKERPTNIGAGRKLTLPIAQRVALHRNEEEYDYDVDLGLGKIL